jgi:heptosyltransferase-1
MVKTSSLGDIIHAFPVIDYLKHRFPSATIDWVVEEPFAPILEAHPAISNVLKIDTKQWRKSWWKRKSLASFSNFRHLLQKHEYDLVVDLQGNTKSAFVTYLSRSLTKVGFGWKTVPEKSNLLFTTHRYNPEGGRNIREDYVNILQQHYADSTSFISSGVPLQLSEKEKDKGNAVLASTLLLKDQKRVMVCPGSHWPNKQVQTDVLADFLHLLRPYLNCNFVFVWGSEKEKKSVDYLHHEFAEHSLILDRLSIPLLQNIMGHMHCVIAMDSLPLHLAATIGVSTFSIFGPSLAEKYKPVGEQHQAWQGSCPYGKTFVKRCPILRTCTTGACIRHTAGKTLFKAFKEGNIKL